jgi:hypothetical protein
LRTTTRRTLPARTTFFTVSSSFAPVTLISSVYEPGAVMGAGVGDGGAPAVAV